MTHLSNAMLIEKARSVINPKRLGEYLVGDVGCALVTDLGNLYQGVCIDAMSGMGFCAEHSAIAAMVTAGEYRIVKIVAVWNDKDGHPHVVSPCGRCREFIRQMHPDNLSTEVIMDTDRVISLSELLPYANWYQKLEKR